MIKTSKALRFSSFLVLAALWVAPVWGKRFSNQYCEFELPNGWVCALEGSEWVCQSENEDRKKEAIIILAAKIRGEQDSLEDYNIYLKKTKTYTLPGGKMQVSEPKYTKMTDVNSHQWVDALHLASEVPGFFTRYLATVKEDLGVAVTFSVAKDLYGAYQDVFEKMVQSLRVFRDKKDVGTGYQVAKSEGDLADATFIPDGEKVDISVGAKQTRKDGEGGDSSLIFIIGGAAVAGLFLLKKKNKK